MIAFKAKNKTGSRINEQTIQNRQENYTKVKVNKIPDSNKR